MSDFIFSTKNFEKGILTHYLKELYQFDEITEFHGEWGSLAISLNDLNTNYCFSNNSSIMIGLGNPASLHNLNSKINLDCFNQNTDWSKIINGPFSVMMVNKTTEDVNFITDLMSFIPLYKYDDEQNIFISSHIDLLAKLTNQINNRDEISELDFILNGAITYPYTSYNEIKQLAPGTEFKLGSDNKFCENQYWAPYEINTDLNINDSALKLRKILEKDIERLSKNNNQIAHFLSGGEDSRVIGGLLENTKKDGYVFLDSFNREGKLASKIANIYNSNLTIKYRKSSYYLDILKACSKLVGKDTEYKHGHAFGFVKECGLAEYSYVFGGVFADALLKGSHIKKSKVRQKLLFLPQVKSNSDTVDILPNHYLFNREAIEELNNRRKKHLYFIRNFREESALEWFELYPASMNNNVGNYHVNRRLFNSYEPFLSNEIVKFSAETPQSFKLNRKVFNLAFNSILKKSKFIMHSDGFFPYFPWYINGGTQFFIKSIQKSHELLFNTNEGSWADWNKLMASKSWKDVVESLIKNNIVSYPYINKELKKLLIENQINIYQKLNLMQLIYLNNTN